MCGRYTLAAGADELVESFDVPLPEFELVPRYNVAPGQDAPVVATDRRGRRMGLMRWGLVPGWKDEAASPFVNARSESARTTPSFREAYARRRCVVPADGFYEWRGERGNKIPYWFHPPGGGVVALAAIWERWRRPGEEPRHGFAILTTDANDEVAPVHDRMPLVIPPRDLGPWLDASTDLDALDRLLRPAPAGSFALREVSTRVNRADEDDAALIEPVATGG